MKRTRRIKLLSMLSDQDDIAKIAQEAISEVEPPENMPDVETPEDITYIKTNPYGYQVADQLLSNIINDLLPEIVEEEFDKIVPDESILE